MYILRYLIRDDVVFASALKPSFIFRDAMLTATINCLTSLLAGFVVFAVLGYMAHIRQSTIEELALQGKSLRPKVHPTLNNENLGLQANSLSVVALRKNIICFPY